MVLRPSVFSVVMTYVVKLVYFMKQTFHKNILTVDCLISIVLPPEASDFKDTTSSLVDLPSLCSRAMSTCDVWGNSVALSSVRETSDTHPGTGTAGVAEALGKVTGHPRADLAGQGCSGPALCALAQITPMWTPSPSLWAAASSLSCFFVEPPREAHCRGFLPLTCFCFPGPDDPEDHFSLALPCSPTPPR